MNALSDDARQRALQRFEALRPHLEEGVPLATIARHLGLSDRTLQRWVRRYRERGLAGLARAPRADAGHRRLPADLERRRGVRVVGRLLDVAGTEMRFADGERAEVAAVIWATGYTEDARWVAIPEAKDTRGALAHWRGVSPVAGLYVVGRSWQWSRGSALLAGVGADAAYVARRIDAQLSGRRTAWDEVERRDGATAATTARLRMEEGGQGA